MSVPIIGRAARFHCDKQRASYLRLLPNGGDSSKTGAARGTRHKRGNSLLGSISSFKSIIIRTLPNLGTARDRKRH